MVASLDECYLRSPGVWEKKQKKERTIEGKKGKNVFRNCRYPPRKSKL